MGSNTLVISNVNEVYVSVDCSEGQSQELREYFTFEVPGAKFTPQYRAHLWDGKIRLWDSRRRVIYRGLVPYVSKFAEERGYDWEYDNEIYGDEFSLVEAKEFVAKLNLPFEVRDYQLEAFVHSVRTRRGVLLSPTASGKSLIIYLLVRYYATRTLIIVPTTSLVSQLYSDFADYGFQSDRLVHRIYSGQDKQTDKPIVISTWQSIYKLPEAHFKSFELVIGDEAHNFKAKSLATIMENMTKTKYRFGFTGTLDGTKTHKLVLEGLFGPVHRVTTTKELMDNKHVAEFSIKCILLKHSDLVCQAVKDFTYQQEIEYLVLNEARNKFITNLSLSLNGNSLILYQYVDKHGKILHDMVAKAADADRKVFFIYGKTDVEVREEIRAIVESHLTKDEVLLEFGDKKIRCSSTQLVRLSDGSQKMAKDITENDDVEDQWILNRK